jgi:hypothetical protein
MPSTRLSRMLAVLRRYTGAAEKERAPDDMIEQFKAAAGETAPAPPKSFVSDEDRPTVH